MENIGYKNIVRIYIYILLIFWANESLSGQTCCSGGIPIASNIGYSSQSEGTLLTSIHFEQNYLNTLLNNSNTLPDNNRKRITNSYIWRLGYTFNQHWSFETLLPYIIQKREIIQNSGQLNEDITRGIGDLVFLLKYDLVSSLAWNVNLGLGPKFGTGNSDRSNNNGLLLIKDLQPGTGATDLLARAAISHSPSYRPSSTIFVSMVFSKKGTDETYLGSQSYTFGDDLQIISGISDQYIMKNTALYPSLAIRYRKAGRDIIDNNALANTGGKWIFLRTVLGLDIHKNVRVTSSLELPVYSWVDGTQLNPTHIFNIGLLANFAVGSTSEITIP